MASTAEEAELERRVFQAADGDSSSDTASDSDDSEDTDFRDASGEAAAGRPPVGATADHDVHEAKPNVNPNPSGSAPAPQNGERSALSPEGKRRRIEVMGTEDSRRLFQRLFTDEDEITILQGFLEFTAQRGTTHASYQYDTGPFYDAIKVKLPFDFSRSQLVEKLRRLKKKYRTAVSRLAAGRPAFKTPHDRATFDISRQIWSPTFKRPRDQRAAANAGSDPTKLLDMEFDMDIKPLAVEDAVLNSADQSNPRSERRGRKRTACEPVDVAIEASPSISHRPALLAPPAVRTTPVPSVIEETVRSCLSPLFKELLNCAVGSPCVPGFGIAGALNPLPISLATPGTVLADDEKWRKQQILELEVYLKRIELVREQIKSKLEELRSTGN